MSITAESSSTVLEDTVVNDEIPSMNESKASCGVGQCFMLTFNYAAVLGPGELLLNVTFDVNLSM